MEIEKTLTLAGGIVSSYLSNSHVSADQIPKLLADTHAAVVAVATGAQTPAEVPGHKMPTPAEIKKSITHDALMSFEDGKSYKTLRRHLTMRGLTPQQYRAKYGLPADYPVTAAGYSAQRSELAKAIGLGQGNCKAPT